jgi:predicted TPR repeat methyltransferase
MNTQTSYDRVVEEYVRRIYDELQYKPLELQLLDCFAESVRGVGPACDMGCGPRHVVRDLRERGVQVCGIDLSPGMIESVPRFTRSSTAGSSRSNANSAGTWGWG